MKGQRYWIDADGLTDIFCKKMLDRCNKDLHTSGKIPQIQTPIEAGCAVKLSARMPAHHEWGGLEGTALPWGLLLSCLKVAEIEVITYSTPIFKIWNHDQFGLAEILITMLTGSMVRDGGCNPKQPGTNPGRDISYTYEAEKKEVFNDHDWIRDNMKEDGAEVKRGIRLLTLLEDKLQHATPEDIKELGPVEAAEKALQEQIKARKAKQMAQALDIIQKQEELKQKIEERIEEIKEDIEAAKKYNEEATELVLTARLPLDFHNCLHQRLEKKRRWIAERERGEASGEVAETSSNASEATDAEKDAEEGAANVEEGESGVEGEGVE
ncbi:hypothetical protein G7Y89_g279 [Cudoniella acicularis]|uniref:Uncharacterized protein n=1 Tax=Cudoniella acicularis TaxID=354080 RepID=A0A8H4RYH3_9HELO|nr:hypothetical protein G7Y89_g279 [Cudoniella acicularis]